MAEEEGPKDYSTATLVLGIVACVALLVGFFLSGDPFPYLFVAFGTGVSAFVLGLLSRRNATATTGMVMGQVAAAGTLFVVIVYAIAIVSFLALVFLFWFWFNPPPTYYHSSGCDCSGCTCVGPTCGCSGCCSSGSSNSSSSGGCCGSGGGCCGGSSSSSSSGSCCGGSSSSSSSSGGCCSGSGSSGSGSSGSGGGCCAAVVSTSGLAHHPDLPEFAEDVYVVRGARCCVGCFTTFPVMLAASLALALAPPLAPTPLLVCGAALASLQAISSAGLAKRRWMKVVVKASLGLGLALVVAGVRAAPWAPQLKVIALVGVAALAVASAIPRARRMRAAAS